MRSTVAMLTMLLSATSACSSDDDSTDDDNGAASSSGTTDDSGGGDIKSPDGATDTGGTSGSSEGDFGISQGEDETTDTDTDGDPPGVDEGFEDVLVGEQPGDPWQDVVTRISSPTIESPTAVVIDTEGADGSATRALQISDAIGTSQGLVAAVDLASQYQVVANVRIDQFSDAEGDAVWPIAVGVTQDTAARDLNDDPHAVVLVGADGSWHLRVKNGDEDSPTLNANIAAPSAEVGQWYRVLLEVNTDTGAVHGRITDPTTDAVLGDNMVIVSNWDDTYAEYDAIALYDGEYDATGGTQGGQASIDDVSYSPTYVGG